MIMRKLVKWLGQRRKEDTIITQILKLGYSIGQNSWIHAIISSASGIVIPILYTNGKTLFVIFFSIFLIIDILYAYICNKYQSIAYNQRKYTSQILENESSLLKSIVIEMENNNNWKNRIFTTVSILVCEKIYQSFKEIFHCETRIAIEYVFNKNSNNATNIKYVKMAGRKSKSRDRPRKSQELSKREKYYSYKIFMNNNNGINILDEDKISNQDLWYKNPHNNINVKRYIGIAVNVYDENDVKYILEIDFIDDFYFGDNNNEEDIKLFIDQYLMAYINVLSISYLLNLNSKKEIPGE